MKSPLIAGRAMIAGATGVGLGMALGGCGGSPGYLKYPEDPIAGVSPPPRAAAR